VKDDDDDDSAPHILKLSTKLECSVPSLVILSTRINRIGGWVGPRPSLNVLEKSLPPAGNRTPVIYPTASYYTKYHAQDSKYTGYSVPTKLRITGRTNRKVNLPSISI